MRPLSIALLLTLVALFGFATVQGVAHVAHAQGAESVTPAAEPAEPTDAPVTTLPDPVEDPIESAHWLYRLYKQGALIPGLVVLVFFLLKLASRYVPYLQRGKVALVITAVLGGLGMVVETAAAGTTPNFGMWLAALSTMLALLAPPTPAPKPASTEPGR